MDDNNQHKILAEQILNEFLDEVTGDKISRTVGKTPEECYFIGQLSPNSSNQEINSSKIIIHSIGMNFTIPYSTLYGAELNIYPCGNLFYRVYPTYKEQCDYMLKRISQLFKIPFESVEDILLNEEVINKINDKPSYYMFPLVSAYEKIAIEDFHVCVNLKIKDIYDKTVEYGKIDELHSVNASLDVTLNNIKDNFVVNRLDYYRNDIRSKVSIENIRTEDSWRDFLNNNKGEENLYPNWKITVFADFKRTRDNLAVSIKFCNDSPQAESELGKKRKNQSIRISTIFNARIDVELISTTYIPIQLSAFKDDYKYDRTQPALGFNCNIDFNKLQNSFDYLATTNIPIYKQYRLKTNDSIKANFEDLINNPVATLMVIYNSMLVEHGEWQQNFVNSSLKYSEKALEKMEEEISDFKIEIERFKIGINLIRDYNIIRESFVCMNKAFAKSPKNYGGWRLFQIVYITSVILDIATCEKSICLSEDIKQKSTFDMADVIFFPTGGGKTEAFLGIVVYNLFFDRLRGKKCGVTSIIRYPLRLLAAQQAERVANILAQAELIRRENPQMADADEFSMGYFCGEGNTPNKLGLKKIQEINEFSQEEKDKQYLIVEKCPYCGENLHIGISEDELRLVHYCPNKNCSSGGIIPVYIVDKEIYRYLPSVIISTIDKMAAIGFNRNFQQLLNGATKRCPKHGYVNNGLCIENDCKEDISSYRTVNMYDPAPTLLIQDELHLIRESLGTYDSHYESFIDYYCRQFSKSHRGMKVIGATATIADYEDQIQQLFLKTPKRFPCASISLKKHFYFYIDEDDLNRLILGYAPFGRSVINSIVYSLKYIRKVVWKYVKNPELILNIVGLEQITIEEAIKIIQDYWLCIEYNNVKLDSSNVVGALDNPINVELVDEDIKKFSTAKMTGDDSFQDVRTILAQIEMADDIVNDIDFNIIAATSMISHGVDADRFNSIFFFGMPGSTAEYIQAYSRVGRKYTGLAVDIIRPSRPTDQSYLKYFEKFHEYKDILIDPVPINRWANKAVEVTLPGMVSGLILGVYLPKIGRKIYMMNELKKVFQENLIGVDEIKDHLYKIYGCEVNGIEREIGRYYKKRISNIVDVLVKRILENTYEDEYITSGFHTLGYHVMTSLRDTEKQLIVELE